MENRILVAHKNGVPPICFKQISRSLFPWQQDQSISAEISQRWDLFQYLYRISLSNISLSKDCVHHETEKKKKPEEYQCYYLRYTKAVMLGGEGLKWVVAQRVKVLYLGFEPRLEHHTDGAIAPVCAAVGVSELRN